MHVLIIVMYVTFMYVATNITQTIENMLRR
jgi:hypothetical protein